MNLTPIPPVDPPWHTVIRSMLADPAFCFPIAAAQVQYRERYYGMSAAGLLEDLFFDALVYFTRQNAPDLVPVRPPRGEQGYDYEIGGVRISHKVGQRASPIAVLWDATRRIERWSATSPIVYHSFDAKGRQRLLSVVSGECRVATIVSPAQRVVGDMAAAVVRWESNGAVEVLDVIDVSGLEGLAESQSFWRAWSMVHGIVNPANHVEMLLVKRKDVARLGIVAGSTGALATEARSGIYLLDPDLLQDVELVANNRAQLIPAASVDAAMKAAAATGRFVALPTWFSLFARSQPPSLYLAQKAQFDAMFSE